MLKLDGTGDIEWQKTYGGTGIDQAFSIQQISDGGYIVAGKTNSFGAGGYDIWFLKLDGSGEISDSCPPGIGQNTNVSPVDNSVTPENTQATVSNTSCTVTSTSITPQDTNITVATQCEN